MKKFLVALLMIAAADAGAQAPPQVQGINITEYGIYTAAKTVKQIGKDERGDAIYASGPTQLTKSTTKVPLQKGIRFGLKYTVVGTPAGADVPIRIVLRYPPPGLRKPGASSPIPSDAETVTAKLGAPGFVDYAPGELVPGQWTYEFWSGKKKLAEQAFTLGP